MRTQRGFQVRRIAHFGLQISGAGTKCLVDPLFEPPHEGAFHRFHARLPSARRTCAATNLLVLTSSAWDRFSPGAVALLDRSVPVAYPASDTAIEDVLETLGFQRLFPIRDEQPLHVGGLTLTPVLEDPMRMGMCFSAEGSTLWNPGEAELRSSTVSRVHRRSPVDVVIVGSQKEGTPV